MLTCFFLTGERTSCYSWCRLLGDSWWSSASTGPLALAFLPLARLNMLMVSGRRLYFVCLVALRMHVAGTHGCSDVVCLITGFSDFRLISGFSVDLWILLFLFDLWIVRFPVDLWILLFLFDLWILIFPFDLWIFRFPFDLWLLQFSFDLWIL